MGRAGATTTSNSLWYDMVDICRYCGGTENQKAENDGPASGEWKLPPFRLAGSAVLRPSGCPPTSPQPPHSVDGRYQPINYYQPHATTTPTPTPTQLTMAMAMAMC